MVHSVLINVPTAEFARHGAFYDYFNRMEKPEGTGVSFARGQSPARNRNLGIQQAIDNDFKYVLFLDDDILMPPNLIHRLMRHDKDIVSALYLMRSYPHQPIVFDYADEKGRCRHYYPPDGEAGLIKAVTVGLGAVLIKTEVFKKMAADGQALDNVGKPCWITMGELEPDHWCDDVAFFHRARKSGFDVWCDTSTPVGHIFSGVVWPDYKDGKWHTTYDSFGVGTVSFPAVRPEWKL